MEELNYPKMHGDCVTGMTVHDALLYQIPMENLKVLGADMRFYVPSDYIRIELNPPVIRFRARLSKDENYYIRKSLEDLVFCNLPKELIKLKYTEKVLEDLRNNIGEDALGEVGITRLTELLEFIKVRLILTEKKC